MSVLKRLSCGLACSVALSPLMPAAIAVAQGTPATLQSVLASNVAARGGEARLDSVRTEELRGHIVFSDGSAHPLAVDLVRPGRIRTQITMDQGMIVQAYDGRVAWTISPGTTGTAPAARLLPEGDAQNVAAGGDMDGALVHSEAKGNRLTLVGIDTADGRPAYVIDVVTKSGLNDTYYIDTVSHLQTKWRGKRVMNGAPVTFVSMFRDHRRINGVMIAFRIDSFTEGQAGGQHIVLDSVHVNDAIPDAEFTMPGSSAASEGAP